LVAGSRYCVRVRASNDVVSEWTQINGEGMPAFRYLGPGAGSLPADGPAPTFRTPSAAYLEPAADSLHTRLPLFVWQPIQDAQSYYVVVAKDSAFTEVLDVALTNLPMYAPRARFPIRTYPDETTAFYWAVVPAKTQDGKQFNTVPTQNNPRAFQKRSVPPTLLSPANDADIQEQPVFRWTATEGADDYQIQVAADPSFGQPLDNVTTAATSYTSETTYPADTVLYWRVRATDAGAIGLTWSQTGTFRRRLARPNLVRGNPTRGGLIPVLRWNPVQGAVSYDVHVQQADGTDRDFRDLRSTAFTATTWYGTGVWRWQVRANFPTGVVGSVHGGYTRRRGFTRVIPSPKKPRKVKRGRGVLLTWKPTVQAKNYRVELSKTDSFNAVHESATTDHTSWAPKLSWIDFIGGGKYFWRVAAVDEGGNTGGWRTGKLRLRKP
jgi:hypothetical protein